MTQNDSSYSHILIGGDFNYHEIDWTTWTTSKLADHHSQTFLDICRDVYLFQQVSEPTQVRHGQKEKLLDLILTSDDQMVHGIEHLLGLGISYHLCPLMGIYVYTPTVMDKKPKQRYHKGKYKEMTVHLAAQNWAEPNECIGILIIFMNIFEDAIDWFIPTSKPPKERRKKLWVNREALAMQKKKHTAWKQYK
ncbi:hypothetical protein LSH36_88g00014 [Paralvinella palmiformis]|uniref:Endonuclease/exonuclease/phosphatase domain-containing protein n=1 Tax=Paralvinella palmiformis TaxID=53620 RepID=A0AAD9NAJ7_9ANNE|nr:hypothetical protein LSH36_88g00014 [Paralvinella palmiformis]